METKIKELIIQWGESVSRLEYEIKYEKNYNKEYLKGKHRAIDDCIQELKRIVESH